MRVETTSNPGEYSFRQPVSYINKVNFIIHKLLIFQTSNCLIHQLIVLMFSVTHSQRRKARQMHGVEETFNSSAYSFGQPVSCFSNVNIRNWPRLSTLNRLFDT